MKEEENSIIFPQLVCIPVEEMVIFPGVKTAIRQRYNKDMESRIKESRQVIICGNKDHSEISSYDYGLENMSEMGTLCKVEKIVSKKDNEDILLNLSLTALGRARITNYKVDRTSPLNFYISTIEIPIEKIPSLEQFKKENMQERIVDISILLRDIKKFLNPFLLQSGMANILLRNILTAGDLTPQGIGVTIDIAAYACNYFFPGTIVLNSLQKLLEELNVINRLSILEGLVRGGVDGYSCGRNFMEIQMHQAQIQFHKQIGNLREQFEQQLPQNDKNSETIKELKKRYHKIKNKMSKEAAEKAEAELKKAQRTFGIDEAMTIKYIETLLSLPWGKYTEDNKDLNNAKKILDEDHAHMERVKEIILEHLAVHENNKSIICFVGPPGVGKTSMGKSIARAMARKFTRLSLGGARDEAMIKGHRRTYIESMPGEIINHIIKTGTANPVFMLDEMDKIGKDFRGDPASALLEVLDPEQNSDFEDNYLNVQFDLSRVFFIGTANVIDTIPPSLLDRMEIIRLSGYTPYEKLEIAVKYLIPKIKKEIVPPVQIRFNQEAILALINGYTEEAGVRQLERSLRRIFQKIAKMYGLGEIEKNKKIIRITKNSLSRYYEKSKITGQTIYKQMPIGCSPVVAVSRESGSGHVFYITIGEIEQDKRSLKFRGTRGSGQSKEVRENVLEKSGHNAFDALISRGSILEEAGKRTKNSRFTINVTNGTTPKDGPSAGIAFLFAFYSKLTGVPMSPNLLATGEITPILGKVGAVGGIRDKAIAVHRAGIKKFIIPHENYADIEDIPKQVIDEVEIITAKTHWDALLEAFSHDQKELERITKFIQDRK